MMESDETDEGLFLLESITPSSDSTKVVLTLDCVEAEIETCLKEKYSLGEVIGELEKKYSQKLSNLDCYHVEYKYVDFLINAWLYEGLQHVSTGFDPRFPLKFIEVLNTISNFADSYKFFGTSNTYNVLISNLSDVSLTLKSQEKECISQLKKKCFNNILDRTSDTKNEMAFVKSFIEAVKSFKDVNLFCQLFHVNEILSCADKVRFKHMLSKLLAYESSCPKLRKLQRSAKKIYFCSEFFCIEDLKNIVIAYLEPVVIKESNADGRLILEVSGKHIVIGNELEKIEKGPKFSYLEEVRFVCFGVIHIDADLSSSIWHGKNIVVYGETLIVSGEKSVVWDVSGKDTDFTSISEAAGTSEDGCGLKGEDGSPGESGGNVCILVESLENFMNFKVVSNGGKGSKGQNGGPGKDGEDGKFLDSYEFKKGFPPVSHLLDKEKNYKKTMESVSQSLLSVDKLYYGLNEFNRGLTKADFKFLIKQNKDLNSMYFETTTEEGCKIQFAFYNEGFFSCCQSFLLHKGALGKEGKIGGSGGCGGKGGSAGDIKIQTINNNNLYTIESATDGDDGEMGISGKTGNPGKSGLDRGYMDCTFAIAHEVLNSVTWPKMFIPGPRDNNRLTVKYYSEVNPNRVKCPHNGQYAEIAQIRRVDQRDMIFRKKDTIFPKHKHQEVHAKRKKNISQRSIVEQYKENDSLWNIYNNYETALEKALIEMEGLNNKFSEETEKISQEAKITRQISYCQSGWYLQEIKHDVKLGIEDFTGENEDTLSSTKWKSCLKSEPFSLYSFVRRVSQTNLSSFTQILFPTSTSTSEISETPNDSLNKYHLDTLKDIYSSISFDHHLQKKIDLKSQLTNIRFLGETDSVVSDAVPGPSRFIEQFFCEDSMHCRQEVVRISSDYSMDDEPLQEALKSFINEFENDGKNEAIIELNKLQKDFNQLRELKLRVKLFPLKYELTSKAKNKNLYSNLLKGILNQNTESKVEFENKTTQDKFLNYLYRSFVHELKKSCDWEIEYFETDVLHIFQTYMMDKGPFATSFREFLAQHYDVNILFYTLNDENSRLLLVSNHNPKARSAMHFLLKRGRIVKLNFDSKFASLFEKCKHLGNIFFKIMFHLCSFTDKQQISHYISNSPLSFDDYSGLASSVVVGIKINHILNQENYVKTISNAYISEIDAIKVKCRLDKLKTEFIGYENILHYMALHFEVEGNQTTADELCFVVNQILKFSIEESNVMPLVSWILAAQPQQLWILELALLKLELYLKKPLNHETKCKWRKYIKEQTEKASLKMFLKKLDCETCHISEDDLDELLYLMGNVPKAHIGLENINLSEWKYYLKDRFWAHQLKSITKWSEEELKTLSFYLVTWENLVGREVCIKLVGILKEHANEIKTELDKDVVLTVIKSTNSKEVCFNDDLWNMLNKSSVKKWQNLIHNKGMNTLLERTLHQIVQLVNISGNTSKNILNIISAVERSIMITNSVNITLKENLGERKLKKLFSGILNPNKSETSVHIRIKSLLTEITSDGNTFEKTLKVLFGFMKPITQHFSIDINKYVTPNLKGDQSNNPFVNDNGNQNMFLPLLDICVQLKHKKLLRNTQKITVMTFLTNAKNTLAQVSTGEGKSLIVVAVAIIKALSNEKVNIITSSKVLARRDANMYRDIYELCGLTVGHNCSDNIEERKKVYSNCQVIYGELANFQRDYLLDRVYNKNILSDCSFETVIVDEVDSMLLDKGNNVLYLSHEIPGLDKIEPVFIYIWKWISRPIPYEHFEDLFNVQTIKDKIMYDIFGVIKKENIKQLDTSMSEKQVDRSWECLIENEVINHHGKVLKKNVNSCNIDGLSEGCIPKIHLEYILEKVINREHILHIPQYLHSFVEDHLESWIKSAISAMVMESGRDYIVDVDRSETVSDRNPIITILDRDTGTDLINSQWDDGLHQFLQLKHGCKLSLLSLKAVFISNVSYLKLYKTLYGLTGTLGSTFERELLKEVYDVDFVTIPTAKAKKFSEEPSILCSTAEEWKQNIYEEVCRILSKQRSALIICETIKEVFILKEKFAPHFRPELIHTYTRDYEGLSVTDNLQPGYIIISTNLAGRGTDIKLSKQLIDNGGLYVCVTFLPSNYRVEEQAYGRAARNGEPGTAQLIFRTTRQCASLSTSKVVDVKKQRDINELKRLTDIKSYHETQIDQEEMWFGKFKKVYCNLLKEMKQKEDIKHILLQAFLNEWAFWLDRNKKLLSSTLNAQNICSSLDHFISYWTDLGKGELKNWIKLVADPTQLVKLGLAYLKKGKLPSSLLLFNKVIEEEPYFSEMALYYKVCVTVQQQDLTNLDIVEPLKVVAQKLKQRAESSQMSALEINCLKEQDNKNLIQIDSFLDQQTNISKIYEVILQSVYSILGSEILPEIFIIPGLINNRVAKEIYSNIINSGLLTKPAIKSNIKSEELLFAKDYGLSPNKMKLFISKFEGKEYREQQFLESFEKECLVPSRESFWIELVKCHALINEENYVFIDMQELHSIHPSLCQRIKSKTTKPCSVSKMKIWLYQPEELVQMKDSKELSFFKQDELIKVVGSNMYRMLEKKDILTSNKLATFDLTKLLNPINLNNFDFMSKEDFQTINICEETASKIIEDLVNQHVIKEKSSTYPSLYCLSIDAERIEHIELTTLKAYTYEVRSLMSVCFAFRIAFAKLQLLTTETCENICLPLRIGLHKRMALELKDKELIKKTYVDTNGDVSETLDELYPKSMNKDGYKKLFLDILCDVSCDTVIDMLIKNKWLVKETAIGFFKPQDETYYINPRIKSLLYPKETHQRLTKVDKKLQPTLLSFHSEKETIVKTTLNHLHLLEHLPHVKTVLNSSRGQYLSCETPSFSLTPLLDVLIDKDLSGEIEIFALNGFDQIIVLEEKKWTLRTKCNILYIVTASVCQIAVGVFLESMFPGNGVKICFEGMKDLIFSVSCFLFGHCSLKNYLLNKVVSIASTWSARLSTQSMSGFGQKVSWLSFQSIKQGFKKALGQVSKSSPVSTVAKDCSVKIVTAISQGLIYATVDHVIESQLDKISLAITEAFHSTINETVDNHYISKRVRELCSMYGPADSQITVSACFLKHISNCDDFIIKSLSNTLTLIHNLIELSWNYCKKNTSKTTALDYLEIIAFFGRVEKAIKESQKVFELLVRQINDVLDMIDEDLETIILHEEKNSLCISPVSIPENELIKFVSSVTDDWKMGIESHFSKYLNKKLLSPVVKLITNRLVRTSSKLIFKKSKVIVMMDDVRKKNVTGYKHAQAKKKPNSNQTFDESDYEECLLDLLEKKRNVATFTEIVRKNYTVDTNFIEMCCLVLPKALHRKGVVLPNLEIILQRNGTYQRFSTTDDKCKKTTIIIDPDSNVVSNVLKNKTLIKCGVDLILTKIAQENPALSGFPIERLRSFVAENIESAFGTQTHFPTIEDEFPCVDYYSKINTSVEQKIPYQHSHANGKYVFNINVDIDLRNEEHLSSLSLVEDHIFNGFVFALNKINNHIHNVQDHLRHFKLSLEDFEETNYDIVPQSNRALEGNFHCFATHYKLVMPFVVDFNKRLFEDFTITMTLNNQGRKTKPYSPCGPHITYEISPNVHFKFVNKGIKGHVLINKECSEDSFNVNNCHIAGDLILPTDLQLQKPLESSS